MHAFRPPTLPKSALQNYNTASTVEASRLAALLVGRMLPGCSLLASGDPGASAPDAAPSFCNAL